MGQRRRASVTASIGGGDGSYSSSTEVIEGWDTPLATFRVDDPAALPPDSQYLDIIDEAVPLGDLPQTGDSSPTLSLKELLLSTLGLSAILKGKRKEKPAE